MTVMPVGARRPLKKQRLFSNILLISSINLLGISQALPPPQGRPSFAIQPLGKMDPLIIELARVAIAETFGYETVALLSPKSLPESAYYEQRKRYRAEKILEYLYSLRTDKIEKIVGLTISDISTTKDPYDDWGIFGMAFINGSTCVVSTFRLGEGKVDTARFHKRFKKVITHEVGHILGLPHCPTPGCLMHDVQGRIATVDGSDGRLCRRCRESLGLKEEHDIASQEL